MHEKPKPRRIAFALLARAAAASPPASTQSAPPLPDAKEFGCPAALVPTLRDWTVQLVKGGGAPPGVQFGDDQVMENFAYHPRNPGDYTFAGIGNGVGTAPKNLIVRNATIRNANKWGCNSSVNSMLIENVSVLEGVQEHDWYMNPQGRNGGEVLTPCLHFKQMYSYRAASQVLQITQRQSTLINPAFDYSEGGPILIDGWLAVDHARANAEGGNGARRSQAFKVFSAQHGAANEKVRKLLHRVDWRRITLDDTMQTSSAGAMLCGDNLGMYVGDCVFRGGNLEMEAVRIEPGTGKLEIKNCEFTYRSAESGEGITIHDLTRPVKIHGCSGNIRIYGPDQKPLAHIKDGYQQNWKER
jgi:hypothetical protein